MNELENAGEIGPEAAAELRSELQVLRVLMAVALLMLIGFTVCADYFLAKQIQFQDTESAQFQMVVDNFPHAAASDFVKHLQDYARTHPDFAPIKAKYPGLFNQPLPNPKK